MEKSDLQITWQSRLSIFATRPFAAVTIGGLLSAIGSSAASVTLVWFVLSRTRSPLLVGILYACYFGARIIAQACTGIIVDRVERGRVMIYGDILSGLLFTGVSLLAASSIFRIETFIILYILIGLCCQLYPVSSQSALPDIVAEQDLIRANAAMQACLEVGGLIGPAIGAILLTTVGPTSAFAMNAISFFVSAIATTLGHIRSKPDHEPQPVLSDLVQGLNSLLHTRILLFLCIVGFIIHIVVIPTETVLLSTLVKNVLHAPAFTYGLAITCLSIGSLVCGAILSFVQPPLPATRMLMFGCIAEGCSVIGLGLSPSPWFLWIIAALYGAAGSLLFAYVLSVVQQSVSASLRGRTFSSMYLGIETGSVVGLVIAGPLVVQFGPRLVLISMGLFVLLTVPLLAVVRTGNTDKASMTDKPASQGRTEPL